MKPKRNAELNFLYMDEKYQDTQKKKKEKIKNKGQKKSTSAQDNIFNFENEIVIGVTKVPNKKKEKVNKHKKIQNRKKDEIENNKIKKNKKQHKDTNPKNKLEKENQADITKLKKAIPNRPKQYETIQVEVIQEKEQDKQKKNKKKNKQSEIKKKPYKKDKNLESKKENKTPNKIKKNNKIKTIIKWTTLVIALFISIIFFMMSPVFDLSQIQVINNEKVDSDTIISLSEIKIGENIYKNSNKQIEKNIKKNPYIENVKIEKKIPNKILITVKERKATFMLEYANSYVYINNQGYILEIAEEKLNLPIISGYLTNIEEIKEGSRLVSEDLEKLAVVLKIIESASGNGIDKLITKINIEDNQNYILTIEGEKKTVYLGDVSNLSTRMLYLKAVLEEEKGIEGEIFINGDLHKTSVYFRKKE